MVTGVGRCLTARVANGNGLVYLLETENATVIIFIIGKVTYIRPGRKRDTVIFVIAPSSSIYPSFS